MADHRFSETDRIFKDKCNSIFFYLQMQFFFNSQKEKFYINFFRG